MILAFLGAIVACSGGSGGSGGGTTGISYSGATYQAAITSDNANTLIGESVQGALTGDSMVPLGVMSSDSDSDNISLSGPTPLSLQALFAASLADIRPMSRDAQTLAYDADAAASESVYGQCGGSATFAAAYDQGSGLYSGSFQFNGYCNNDVSLTGKATFVMRMNQSAGEVDYFKFVFINLTSNVGGEINTISGSLECYVDGTDVTIYTEMVHADGTTGMVYWLDDFTIQGTGSQLNI